MKEANCLEKLAETKNAGSLKVCTDTSIKELVKIIRRDKTILKKHLTNGLQVSLIQIEKYVDTIGDLKKLAENADGFSRLKSGIIYNNGRELPSAALKSFGEKRLEYLNNVLSLYGIDQIPWTTKKYAPGERQAEKGWDWWKKVNIYNFSQSGSI